MKLVYLGSPAAAVPPLNALLDAGHEVVLVISQPDRRRGRGSALSPSPVKAAALARGVTVSDRPDDVLAAVNDGAQLGVVVAYGKLIKPHLLAAMPFVNIHFSLLPRWRGAAPVERALLAGDAETGVCLMGLEEGLDTGPVYRRDVTPIDPNEPVSALRDRLVSIGTAILVDSLRDGFTSLGHPSPQTGEPTYAAKFDASEFAIDWSTSASAVHRLVRLGVAWTVFRGKRLKVLEVAMVETSGPEEPRGDALTTPGSIVSRGGTDGVVVDAGDGPLRLVTVQPEGKAPMLAHNWNHGAKPQPGEKFGVNG